ncbi:MAG: hypothetical protein JSW65_00895 [Candidatus Bipolaricaulota bacterium]|nr:MAG: hypothetical protein JSW65_00895 [Candidatus Bipolaricaulota bacterium]
MEPEVHGPMKRHTDSLDGIFTGLVFIWGALVLAGELSGYKDNFACWTNGWEVFFSGVGALAVLGAIVRMIVPRYRHRIGQAIVFGCILLGIGLGDRAVWIWPVLLGVAGLTILRGVLLRRS